MTVLERRPFGRTGVDVGVLGLGSLFVGRTFGTDREEGARVVRAARRMGVDYIDCAPFYGDAQAVVGEAIGGVKDGLLLSTKCGRWDHRDGPFWSFDAYRRQLDATLADLGVDAVDLLYVHEADWYVFWEQVDEPRPLPHVDLGAQYEYERAPVLAFLEWAREQGLTQLVGLSGNNADLLAKVLRELPVRVDAVLCAYQYDLLWRNAVEELIPSAVERGAAVVVATPFHQGRLAAVHPEWLTDAPPWMGDDMRPRLAALYEIQRECGLSLPELALRFLVGDRRISCILAGAASEAELEENVRSAAAGPLPTGLHDALAGVGAPFPGRN